MKKQPQKRIDPKQIFQQADRFWLAKTYLLASRNPTEALNKGPLAVPAIVISAFASELYLKCLLCIRHGHPHREIRHDLAQLFQHLSPSTQQALEQAWDAKVKSDEWQWALVDKRSGKTRPRDLRSNLQSGRNGFQDVRYIYENVDPDSQFNLGEFPPLIRNVIIKEKPEWNLSFPVILDPEPFRIKPEDYPEIFAKVHGKGEIDNWPAAL